MSARYRITVTETHTFVIEGEGTLPHAEERLHDSLSGLIREDGDEVSSYRSARCGQVEFLLGETEEGAEIWGTLS
jgi:hypothetical protein